MARWLREFLRAAKALACPASPPRFAAVLIISGTAVFGTYSSPLKLRTGPVYSTIVLPVPPATVPDSWLPPGITAPPLAPLNISTSHHPF